MQKLYKCTPGSVHIPAELPEDLDPDNIRQPQNDDAGIDGTSHIQTYYVPEYVDKAVGKLQEFFGKNL